MVSGFEWIVVLFYGVIAFRVAEVVAQTLGCGHLVALACGVGVMAMHVLGYVATRPMILRINP